MFTKSPAYSGFAVTDINAARAFYRDSLGLAVRDTRDGLEIDLANGTTLFVYAKPDHAPASFTILNFPVDDMDRAIDELRAAGIELERYDGLTGDDGIFHAPGGAQAWFRDPAGNILSLLEDG